MIFQNARFLISAAKATQVPEDTGAEVAFAGRSNAGKSSAINVITNQRGLARTSKTPGRTQLINFFALDEDEARRLVDLPGYGYAKVAESVRRQWQAELSTYLNQRQSLNGLILLMDIRHPLKDFDLEMLGWAQQRNLAVHVLLTKSDKLKRGAAKSTQLQVQQQLKRLELPASVQCFSSLTRDGLDQVQAQLTNWLEGG